MTEQESFIKKLSILLEEKNYKEFLGGEENA